MISIVVCSRDDARFDVFFKKLERYRAGLETEVIRIPDATGLAEGYARGLSQSTGESVIFCHDDIEFIGDKPLQRVESHLSRFDGIGLAGTTRLMDARWIAAGPPYIFGQVAHAVETGFSICFYGVPSRAVEGIVAMDGLFLAFRRDVIERVGWDSQGFPRFHGYDVDTTFRAYRMGYRLAVVCDIPVIHQSGGAYDEDWMDAARAFMAKHGGHLLPFKQVPYTIASVQVRNRMDALQAMCPDYLER